MSVLNLKESKRRNATKDIKIKVPVCLYKRGLLFYDNVFIIKLLALSEAEVLNHHITNLSLFKHQCI